MTDVENITLLLTDVDSGKDGALDELMSVVYEDLERMAQSHLRKQFGSKVQSLTLEPAALVNESFMKLIRQRNKFDNRGHFFAIATKIMLRVLIDYRRSKNAQKRGGSETHITLIFDDQKFDHPDSKGQGKVDIEDLKNALEKLENMDAQLADIVRMKVVWDLTIDEIAESLGVSDSTVKRGWRFARAWLADEIGSP